jgi:hypothetical protein
MLEFICLSKRPALVQKLSASIRLAVGDLSPFNLTVIDGEKHDLFSGFNAGAKQTQGDLLAFIHDDVQLLGNPLTMAEPLKALSDPKTGFVGVAGARLLPEDACWWGGHTRLDVMNECRGMAAHADSQEFGMHFNVWPSGVAKFGRVLVLDGVLLMCHRRTFESLNGFDEQTYKGFDFYDIDITFRASLAKLNNLAAPIPVLHQSGGIPGPRWDANRKVFLSKFGHMLPARIS